MRRRRPAELDLDAVHGFGAERGDVLDSDQAPLTHEADAVADALHLGQDAGGEEDGPARRTRLVHHGVELALYERVEARGRLVEDHELGAVHERLDETELAFIACREVAGAATEVEVEARGERLNV